jgi:hypothetical protein
VSDFFEPPPPPPEPEPYRQPPWVGPPSNVLGVAVPLRLLLARTADVAVAVVDATAYPTGLEFRVMVRRRERDRLAFDDPLGFHGLHRGELAPDVLRFGVQLSDGSKATSLDGFPPARVEPPGPVLMRRGGGGGGGQWDLGFWLYPLPPPGPLAFVCEWPSESIGLTRQEIDADVIRAAADRAEVLWEEEHGPPGPRFSTAQLHSIASEIAPETPSEDR